MKVKILLIVLFWALPVFAVEDSFDKLGKVQDPAANWSRMEELLYRSNKPHQSNSYRYQYHVSHREYLDCSYLKKVDCTDKIFCRCWQCKDYRNGKKIW